MGIIHSLSHYNSRSILREYRLGVDYAAKHDGLLPGDQFWSLVRTRHDLNPTRFDHNHPRFGRLLDRDAQVRAQSTHSESPPASVPRPDPGLPANPIPVAPVVSVPVPPFSLPSERSGNEGQSLIPPVLPAVVTPASWPPVTLGGGGGDPVVASVPEPSQLVSLTAALVTVGMYRLLRRRASTSVRTA